jgi:hypothetical protein
MVAALMLFLVRKFMRMRRIAKAESPPPSPLLNASQQPFSPTQPLRIELGMHARMQSNDSDSEFWVSGKGSSIKEKQDEGRGYPYPYPHPVPISPLPSLSEVDTESQGQGQGQAISARPNGVDQLRFFPAVDRSGEGKEVVPKPY